MTTNIQRAFNTVCTIFTLSGVIFLTWIAHHHASSLIEWIHELGWMAPFLFIATYCLSTVALLPTMVLTLAGGAIFGPVYGTILNLMGAVGGAALSFLITRHLLFEWFNQRKNDTLKKIISGVDNNGWFFLAVLRLFPIIPFNLVNYGMGVTGMSFRLYLTITSIFLIPPEIFYTYCGYAGMDALSNFGTLYKQVFWPGLILCGVLLLVYKYFKLKRLALPQKSELSKPL